MDEVGIPEFTRGSCNWLFGENTACRWAGAEDLSVSLHEWTASDGGGKRPATLHKHGNSAEGLSRAVRPGMFWRE